MDKQEMDRIAVQIIAMKDSDLELREQLVRTGKLRGGYDRAMEELHIHNATLLGNIMNSIGYPAIDKVGLEASEAAWLILQHSISLPAFMKRCRDLLEQAVIENKADPVQLAYLTDRIAVFEDRPQLYGTQFDWDEEGKLSPNGCDNLIAVDQRRLKLGLNTLQQQTVVIRKQAQKENQFPLNDLEERKREVLEWKKKVGWIK